MDPDTGTPGYLHAMYQITTEPTIVFKTVRNSVLSTQKREPLDSNICYACIVKEKKTSLTQIPPGPGHAVLGLA